MRGRFESRRVSFSCVTVPYPHTHRFTHTHTLKRPMSTENPALLYIEKKKIEKTVWRPLWTETRCGLDSKVCTKVRRPPTHTCTHTHTEASHVNRESCIALHRRKKKIEQTDWRPLWTETRCELDSKVCTKVRRPRTHTHTHIHTQTHRSVPCRQRTLHRVRSIKKRSNKLNGNLCELKQIVG